jgi:hypothetical protein
VNPDDISTTGSNATEERSESRESRALRAFWIPQSVSEHYRSGIHDRTENGFRR